MMPRGLVISLRQLWLVWLVWLVMEVISHATGWRTTEQFTAGLRVQISIAFFLGTAWTWALFVPNEQPANEGS